MTIRPGNRQKGYFFRSMHKGSRFFYNRSCRGKRKRVIFEAFTEEAVIFCRALLHGILNEKKSYKVKTLGTFHFCILYNKMLLKTKEEKL